jgi:DNA-binding LytR/AlgR family response regulator
MTAGAAGGLRVLVVDDEAPARDDLAWLLEREDSVSAVEVAGDANEALRTMQHSDLDVVFLDVRMPGLHGLDLARVLGRFAAPPKVVFVTAHEEHAVEAFELRAYDYLLKPVRAERLREALDRVRPEAAPADPRGTGEVGERPDHRGAVGDADQSARREGTSAAAAAPGGPPAAPDAPDDLAVLTVESAGRTRFVARQDVRYAEASGDYTRLHSADGSHLVRIPLSTLEGCWVAAGFFRIHRSYLVSLQAVSELRAATGSTVVVVEGRELPVSRRQSRALKDALIRFRLGGNPR